MDYKDMPDNVMLIITKNENSIQFFLHKDAPVSLRKVINNALIEYQIEEVDNTLALNRKD